MDAFYGQCDWMGSGKLLDIKQRARDKSLKEGRRWKS